MWLRIVATTLPSICWRAGFRTYSNPSKLVSSTRSFLAQLKRVRQFCRLDCHVVPQWYPRFSATDNSTDQLCLSLLLSYVSEHGRAYPLEIGENYTEEQRNQMAEYLVGSVILLGVAFRFIFITMLSLLGIQTFAGLQIESLHTITCWVFSIAVDVTIAEWRHRFRIYLKAIFFCHRIISARMV